MIKIQKINIILITLFILILIPSVKAATSGDYTYKLASDGTAIITKYTGTEKNVIVPSKIDGYDVITIRTHTFLDNSKIEKVTFSEGIKKIEAYSFANCKNITKVIFPYSTTYISDYFYKQCPKISFNIPDTLTKVPSGEYIKLDHLTINGKFDYDRANEIVKATNEHRKSKGLNELTIDNELMEAAMKRASELSVYYNHIRPNGLDCLSVLEHKVIKENIYASTMLENGAGIVKSWINSGMHNQAMLAKENVSIGVGCFNINGRTYAVQLFSDKKSDNASSKKGIIEDTTTIDVSPSMECISLNIVGLLENISLKVGETIEPKEAKVYNTKFYNSVVYIKKSDITWRSSNENVFIVDNNGKITAKGAGEAVLTAELGNDKKEYNVSVADKLDNTSESSQDPNDEYKLGDVNRDGVINSVDAAMVLDIYNNGTNVEEYLNIADMNEDGVINSVDAALILDMYNSGK